MADAFYSDLLGQDDRYIGDDAAWNEINYANTLSAFSLNNAQSKDHFLRNYATGSFKQCRHGPRLQECTEFHLPSKTLTVKIKTAKARKQVKSGDEVEDQFGAHLSGYDDYYSAYYDDETYDDFADFQLSEYGLAQNLAPFDSDDECMYFV